MRRLAREAAWVTTAEAELARDRREGFVFSREFFRRAKFQTALCGLLLVLFVLVVNSMITFSGIAYGAGGMMLLALALLSFGSIPLARHWERRQAARREADDELRTSFGPGGRLVSLLILQGGAPTGDDRGILWFEDGRMYFSGHRTSFGLVPAQVRGFARIGAPVARVRHEVEVALHHDGAAGPLSLSFSPVTSATDPRPIHRLLKDDIDEWTTDDSPQMTDGQWPPQALGPGVVSEASLVARAIGRSVLLPVVPALGVLALGLLRDYALPLYAFGAWISVATPKGAALWRAVRDRRCVRRFG